VCVVANLETYNFVAQYGIGVERKKERTLFKAGRRPNHRVIFHAPKHSVSAHHQTFFLGTTSRFNRLMIIVSEHKTRVDFARCLQDATILFVSELLLEQLGCSCSDFQAGVMHVQASTTLIETDHFTETSGIMVWRHPRIHCTSTLTFHSECVMGNEAATCVLHVHNVHHCRDEDYNHFVQLLQHRIRGNTIQWKICKLKCDKEFVAVRIAPVCKCLTANVRRRLIANGCICNHTVSFTDERGAESVRALLLPPSMIDTTPYTAEEATEMSDAGW
jgi:hypothetical protein